MSPADFVVAKDGVRRKPNVRFVREMEAGRQHTDNIQSSVKHADFLPQRLVRVAVVTDRKIAADHRRAAAAGFCFVRIEFAANRRLHVEDLEKFSRDHRHLAVLGQGPSHDRGIAVLVVGHSLERCALVVPVAKIRRGNRTVLALRPEAR